MENVKTKVEELSEHVTDYANTFIELTKIRITQKAADSAALAVTAISIFIFSLLILLIGGMGLAWWLGSLMNSTAGGFLIVAGIYLLCLLYILLSGKRIVSSIRNTVIRKLYD